MAQIEIHDDVAEELFQVARQEKRSVDELLTAWLQEQKQASNTNEISSADVQSNSAPAHQATVGKVTEGKPVENDLVQQKELLQTIVDNIPVMIAFIGRSGQTEWINREWTRVLGWSLEDFHNRDILAEMYPDPNYRQYVLDYALKPPDGWHDFRTRTRDGRVIDTAWANILLADGMSIGIGQDISDRKRVEQARERLLEQVRALSRQLVVLDETNRRNLALELHQQVGQNLTAININLNIIRSQLPMDLLLEVAPRIEDTLNLVGNVVESIRGIIAELRPSVLDDYGLDAAVQWYAEQFTQRTGIIVRVQSDGMPRLRSEEELALFRISQEALTNVAKHAQASHVTITLESSRENIRLNISDNGVGFDPVHSRQTPNYPSLGLIEMQERSESVGGHLTVDSEPGNGTRVTVELQK